MEREGRKMKENDKKEKPSVLDLLALAFSMIALLVNLFK